MFTECPFLNGPCIEHKCRLFIQLVGANPQTGEQIDKWNCSIAFLPMLLIENSQQSRQTGAAVESFRNEFVKVNELASKVAAIENKPLMFGR